MKKEEEEEEEKKNRTANPGKKKVKSGQKLRLILFVGLLLCV